MKTPISIFITDTHLSESTIEINKSIFKQVFDLADSVGIKKVIHGGDIFTSRKGQSEIVLNTFKGILNEAKKRGIQIIAIAGNHDKTSYVSKTSFLDAFDDGETFNVVDSGDSLLGENIDIYFLPYYDEALRYVEELNVVLQAVDESRTNILITHVGIDGVKSNSGTLIDNEVTEDMFKPFQHVLIGHYHDRQLVGEKIIYTGSAYQANFGETPDKGCVIIYDDIVDPFDFINLKFPQYITVDILPQDLTKEFMSKVSSKKKEANIRVRIEGEVSEDQKPHLIELQSIGTKVEITKNSFKPLDNIAQQSVTLSSNDIIESYDEWVKEKDIKNAKFGKQILQTVI